MIKNKIFSPFLALSTNRQIASLASEWKIEELSRLINGLLRQKSIKEIAESVEKSVEACRQKHYRIKEVEEFKFITKKYENTRRAPFHYDILATAQACSNASWTPVQDQTLIETAHRLLSATQNQHQDYNIGNVMFKKIPNYVWSFKELKMEFPGRTLNECRDRYFYLMDNRWTEKEKQKLVEIVENLGVSKIADKSIGLRRWSGIASFFPGKSNLSCRYMWFLHTENNIPSNISISASSEIELNVSKNHRRRWTTNDEVKLVKAVDSQLEEGRKVIDWQEVSEKLKIQRSQGTLRRKYYQMKTALVLKSPMRE